MLSLNFQSRKPIYDQLYNNIVKLISIGEMKPGEKLPTVRQIASDLGINPNTASKAYQMLEKDGYIYSVVGKGSFISDTIDMKRSRENMINEKILAVIKEAYDCGLTKDEISECFNNCLSKSCERSNNQ